MIKQKMISQAKKVIFLILTMLLFLLPSACSRTNPEEIITESLEITEQLPEEADESYYNASINTGNSIEIDDETFSAVQSAYNEFLNGKNYFEYNNQPYYISDVMTQPEYSSRRYTLYDMNDDGIPELVLEGQRLYVLSYNQGKLITLLTDQHMGGSYSLVNNGYLYYRHGGIANQIMHCYEKINSSNEHVRYFSLFRYAHPDYDNDSWYETYTYLNSEDDNSHEEEISEAEYEEWVKKMSNDDEIDWQEFYFPAVLEDFKDISILN